MTTNEQNKSSPWLNAQGEELGQEELRLISTDWSIAQWESYAKFLAEKEASPIKEIPVRTKVLNKLYDSYLLQEENEKKIFDYLGEQDDLPHLKEALDVALNSLDTKEREIIKLAFWENKTQREMANKYQISRTRYRYLLNRGLRRLKTRLLAELIALNVQKQVGGSPHPVPKKPISEGQVKLNEEVPY